MRKVTTLLVLATMCFAGTAFSQQTSSVFDPAVSADITDPYTAGQNDGGQSDGARAVAGPYDLDGDGKMEVLVTDFTGGGRVYVIEHQGGTTWELVYATPWKDSTQDNYNGRYAQGGDLDGDGKGEIIYFAGESYSDANPNIGDYGMGLYVHEFTGTDNDYGDAAPDAVFLVSGYEVDAPSSVRVEHFIVEDIDGDGVQEVLYSDGGAKDDWVILSVTGDIGGGFEQFVVEARISAKERADYDGQYRGGGSPYAAYPADLDGDGTYEINMHSWNNFNFTNGDVTGADTYVWGDTTTHNSYLKAADNDDLAFFGGTVADINGDGDDEVFWPRELDDFNSVSVLNYEAGEDVLQITTDQFKLDLIENFTDYGMVSGDLNGDGMVELIAAGPQFDGDDYDAGQNPVYLRIAQFTGGQGGDAEDAANYQIYDVEFPVNADLDAAHMDVVNWDSAGTTWTTHENRISPGKLAFLGDVDGNGFAEVAVSFNRTRDSVSVFNSVWNADSSRFDRTEESIAAASHRPVMRIFEINETFVATERNIILPSDYKLSSNYPNPFNPTTSFNFTLPLNKEISVKVYDVMGRLVRTLVDNELYSAGVHEASWNGLNDAGVSVASGTYFYTLEHGNFRVTQTMSLIK